MKAREEAAKDKGKKNEEAERHKAKCEAARHRKNLEERERIQMGDEYLEKLKEDIESRRQKRVQQDRETSLNNFKSALNEKMFYQTSRMGKGTFALTQSPDVQSQKSQTQSQFWPRAMLSSRMQADAQ